MGPVLLILIIVAVIVVGKYKRGTFNVQRPGSRHQSPPIIVRSFVNDPAAAAWIESLAFSIYEGFQHVDVDSVISGTRSGLRCWIFDVELESHDGFREIESELTGIVLQMPDAEMQARPEASPGVVAIDLIDGYIGIFMHELPEHRRVEVLECADVVIARMLGTGAA